MAAEQVIPLCDKGISASVEQHQVLVRCSSTHIETSAGLTYRFYTRKGKDYLNHICLSKHNGNILHLIHPHLLYSYLVVAHLIEIFCRNYNTGKGIYLFCYGYVQCTVVIHLQVHFGILKRVAAHLQRTLSHREEYLIESILICGGVGLVLLIIYRYCHNRFATSGILDNTAEVYRVLRYPVLTSYLIHLLLDGCYLILLTQGCHI